MSADAALGTASAVVGWLYMICWSVSFYPQVYVNWRARSVVGLSFDYLTYNITGFVCYFAFTFVMYDVPAMRDEFNHKNHNASLVQLNDVAFAAHGIVLLIVQFTQCALYERGGQIISRTARIITALAWLSLAVAVVIVLCGAATWLDVLVYAGTMKVGASFIKYAPQVWMNYRRQSTVGWSIGQVLLDFAGGVLSFGQMGIDSARLGSWLPVTGNVPKLLLAVVSFGFDAIFIVQHYILYRTRGGEYTAVK